jgi:hypothetical protein
MTTILTRIVRMPIVKITIIVTKTIMIMVMIPMLKTEMRIKTITKSVKMMMTTKPMIKWIILIPRVNKRRRR